VGEVCRCGESDGIAWFGVARLGIALVEAPCSRGCFIVKERLEPDLEGCRIGVQWHCLERRCTGLRHSTFNF
jgi:hypothetical protein